MNKSLIAAAAFAALAAGFTGSASAAGAGSGLGGVRDVAAGELTQVHYRKHHHTALEALEQASLGSPQQAQEVRVAPWPQALLVALTPASEEGGAPAPPFF